MRPGIMCLASAFIFLSALGRFDSAPKATIFPPAIAISVLMKPLGRYTVPLLITRSTLAELGITKITSPQLYSFSI
jgi:hypothetical protein